MRSGRNWRRLKARLASARLTSATSRYRTSFLRSRHRHHPRAAASRAAPAIADGIDKSRLAHPQPRRFRDKEHVKFVAKQACLICGRRPGDAHHLRFVQRRALGTDQRNSKGDWTLSKGGPNRKTKPIISVDPQ
jgi:hypothetical protein